MRLPFPPLLAGALWGILCGAALGAARTTEAAAHLLARGRALEAMGIPALPGTGHWEVLASWPPAAAGAAFFGLSLGLGFGTLFGAWASLAGRRPGRPGRWAPWAALAAPAWALWAGDTGLAWTLLATALGAIGLTRCAAPPPHPGRRVLPAACLGLVALGLLPWALSPGGPFTHLRDRFLLGPPAGLALNTLYYRWTLYPAEALKPLDATSQPAVAVSARVTPEQRAGFCAAARDLGVACLPPGQAGADAELELSEGGLALVSGTTRRPWPPEREAQLRTWREVAADSDRARPLRTATAWALAGGYLVLEAPAPVRYASLLLGGCPLALVLALGGCALGLGRRLPQTRCAPWAALASAAALGAGLAWASLPDAEVEQAKRSLAAAATPPLQEVRSLLASPRPALRFYAARGARRLGPQAVPLLTEALTDPVINVRYAAAEALGGIRHADARSVLFEVLGSPEEWYVKERAYAALWRLGWRPF